MTANVLATFAGIVISLAFSYIPGANTWYAALKPEVKRLIMLGCLVLVAAAAYGAACLGWFGGVTCDKAGLGTLLQALFLAAVANQTTYSLSPQTVSVREAKEGRVK